MKIALTGASGFIGLRVIEWLRCNGHMAVPLVRKPSGLFGEIVVGDLSAGPMSLAALTGADAVIHLAARTHVARENEADPVAAYRQANVLSTAYLLDAALDAGINRFVYISSIKASGEWTLPGMPFTSKTSSRPEDAYGASKLEAEDLVRSRYSVPGKTWTILRPPLVHGAGAKGNLDLMIRAISNGIPLPFAGLDNRRSVVHVDNLADAIGRAATMDAAAGKLLLVSDMTLSTTELARTIGRGLGRPVRLVRVPRWIANVLGRLTGKTAQVDRLWGSLEIDPGEISAVLDWTPPNDPGTALLNTFVEWRTKQKAGPP